MITGTEIIISELLKWGPVVVYIPASKTKEDQENKIIDLIQMSTDCKNTNPENE